MAHHFIIKNGAYALKHILWGRFALAASKPDPAIVFDIDKPGED